MKKFLAVLAIISIAAVSGCGGGKPAEISSAETTASSEDNKKHTDYAFKVEDTTQEAIDYLKGKSPLFCEYIKKRVSTPMTMISSHESNGRELRYGIFIKSPTTAAVFSDNEDGTRVTVIYDGDKAYQIDEAEKAVYYIDYGEANVKTEIGNYIMKVSLSEALNSKYGSGIENVNGVDYNYESIAFDASTTYFYFENGTNELRYMKTDGVLTKIIEFKNEVTDESVFVVPEDYEHRTFEDLMAKYAAEAESDQ